MKCRLRAGLKTPLSGLRMETDKRIYFREPKELDFDFALEQSNEI